MDADQYVAGLIARIRDVSSGYPTLVRITASFNVTVGLFTLCSVSGKKKDVLKLANDFHRGLVDHIEGLYEKPPKEQT